MAETNRARPAHLAGSPIADGFRLVAGYVRAHGKPFTVASISSVVYAAGTVGSAFALGFAVDEALVPHFRGADSRHWAAAAFLIGVMVLRSVGVICRRYWAGKTSALSKADLQRGMNDRITEMPLDRLRSRQPGELLAVLDADTDAAVDVMHPTPFTIGVLSMLVFAVGGLATIDTPLMLATVGVLPLVLIGSWASTVILEKPTDRERAANAEVTAATAEIIAGTQVVKTLGREDAELARFATVVDHHREARVRVGLIKMLIDTAFSTVPQLAMILIIVVGAERVANDIIEPGDLVQAVALFGVLAFPIQVIGFFLTDLPVSVVGRRRVDEVLVEPDDPLRVAPVEPRPLPAGPLGAELVDIRIGDGDRTRVDGLALRVEPGETLAIVGPTGSGKSTALDVLARLRPVDAGEVRFAGIPADEIDDAALRQRVTLAAQSAVLFTGSVLDNVGYHRDLDPSERLLALERAGADDLAEILEHGFDTVVGERGVSLSGGQRQRVALARALAGEPGLILLDDATSAVDPAREERILATLADLPTTVVMVTHRVAAMAAADRVALVEDGRVSAVGPHEQLLERPSYRALVEAYESAEAVAQVETS
ncbi:MAG: ABC transporter ATP-binding protein [Actinomycetota bacterium]